MFCDMFCDVFCGIFCVLYLLLSLSATSMVKKLHFKGDPVKKKKKATTGGVKKEESVSLNEPTDSTGASLVVSIT